MALSCDQCGGPSGSGIIFCRECCPSRSIDGRRWSALIRKHGVDKIMFDAMYFDQDGSCVLCPREATVIDHDHSTGRVRGLLCHGCNVRISYIEKPKMLEKALAYIGEGKY